MKTTKHKLTFLRLTVVSGAKKVKGCPYCQSGNKMLHSSWLFKRGDKIVVKNMTSMLVDKTPIRSIREAEKIGRFFYYFDYKGYRCTAAGSSLSSIK